MADDLQDDAIALGTDDENESEVDSESADSLGDIPALAVGDDGEPLEDIDDDEAILADSFSSEEDPEAEDPDAYLYKAPTVSFSDSAEEDAITEWPEEDQE